MSRTYYRPIVKSGAPQGEDAFRLAAGWTWFDQVEVLRRGAPPEIIPASDTPPDELARLACERASVAGMDMSRPNLMAILNVTPDSFSDGGAYLNPSVATDHATQLVIDGADILDIGGESTRPGAAYVEADDEIARTAPVIDAIRSESAVPISIDTRKSAVARAALDAGAVLINDVYAFTHDPALARVAVERKMPVCLMHAQGDPNVMQDAPWYADVLLDVYDFLEERVNFAQEQGISRSQILVDPGIGFGKTLAHNLALLNRISLFHTLGCGVLLGASRKRFIGEVTGEEIAARRDPGSIAAALAAVAQGVQILRVHDVKTTKQALDVWQAIQSENTQQ